MGFCGPSRAPVARCRSWTSMPIRGNSTSFTHEVTTDRDRPARVQVTIHPYRRTRHHAVGCVAGQDRPGCADSVSGSRPTGVTRWRPVVLEECRGSRRSERVLHGDGSMTITEEGSAALVRKTVVLDRRRSGRRDARRTHCQRPGGCRPLATATCSGTPGETSLWIHSRTTLILMTKLLALGVRAPRASITPDLERGTIDFRGVVPGFYLAHGLPTASRRLPGIASWSLRPSLRCLGCRERYRRSCQGSTRSRRWPTDRRPRRWSPATTSIDSSTVPGHRTGTCCATAADRSLEGTATFSYIGVQRQGSASASVTVIRCSDQYPPTCRRSRRIAGRCVGARHGPASG